jgi:acetolactate synthase regulatory subunit
MRFSSVLVVASALVGGSFPAPAEEIDLEELQGQLEVLTEEVRHLKEQMVLPETDEELKSYRGMGPAASKVYGKTSGLSLGGYGEYHFATPLGEGDAIQTADMLRFVTYFGYRYSDHLLMNAEIEYEHGTTSTNFAGKSGSVSVEFAYLDFLIGDPVNVRLGSLLVPMGFLNEMHEPPFYRGNVRPVTETLLIPSTWRELGVGLHGTVGTEFGFKAYVINGFNAKKFNDTGVRGGRQKGNRVLYEDAGLVLALTYDPTPRLTIAASAYAGSSGQNQVFAGEKPSVFTRIVEAHVEFRHRGFVSRALAAASTIDDAGIVSIDLSDAGETVVVPENQVGWYVEAAYDLAPPVRLPSPMVLLAWVRFEDYDLQHRVPAGFEKNEALDASHWVLGLEWKPVPSVVVKTDVTIQSAAGGAEGVDPLRIGAGFIF